MIGIAAMILWFGLGRIAGVSGIAGTLVTGPRDDAGWRIAFVLALIGGAAIARACLGAQSTLAGLASWPMLVVAGLLVGIGTRLGNGCTSGHGVCGLGRLSKRSLVAVLVFMGVAVITRQLVLALGIAT